MASPRPRCPQHRGSPRRHASCHRQDAEQKPVPLSQERDTHPRSEKTYAGNLGDCVHVASAGGTWMAVVYGFGGIAGGSGWAVGIECDVDPAHGEDLTDPCSCRQHEVDDFRHVAGRLRSRPLRRGPGAQGVPDVVEVLERQIMCRVSPGDRAVLIVEWDASGGAFGRRVGGAGPDATRGAARIFARHPLRGSRFVGHFFTIGTSDVGGGSRGYLEVAEG